MIICFVDGESLIKMCIWCLYTHICLLLVAYQILILMCKVFYILFYLCCIVLMLHIVIVGVYIHMYVCVENKYTKYSHLFLLGTQVNWILLYTRYVCTHSYTALLYYQDNIFMQYNIKFSFVVESLKGGTFVCYIYL